MITADGLFTGYIATHGFGSWTHSTAEEIDLLFTFKHSLATFQVSRYNVEVEATTKLSMTIQMKYT